MVRLASPRADTPPRRRRSRPERSEQTTSANDALQGIVPDLRTSFKIGSMRPMENGYRSGDTVTTVREAVFELLRERVDDNGVRQPGLHRAADAHRVPRGLPLRARPAGGNRRRASPTATHRPAGGRRSSTCTPLPASATRWARSSTPRPTRARSSSPPGQQYRSLMTLQANLTNRDAARMPQPLVKWSYEPPRAQDVPHALARAIHMAALPPRGPSFLSIPMDDWGVEVDDEASPPPEHPHGRGAAPARAREASRSWPSGSRGAEPRARRRPRHRRLRAAGTPRSGSPSCSAWPVYATPAPGGGRIGFPENHPLFQGILPPGGAPARRSACGARPRAGGGTSVFPYYPNVPGPLLAEGTELGGDHKRPRRGRARADGRRDRRRLLRSR